MEISPWLVMLLGLGTVFIGLTALIGIVTLMGAIVKGKADKAQSKAAVAEVTACAAPAVSAAPVHNRGELDAVVGASLATYLGTEPGGIRINALQPVGVGGNERKQLSAVIACAIACCIKKDVSAIRILGIKQV